MRPSPLLCTPEEKPKLEAANALEQLDYLQYIVVTLGRRDIRRSDVLKLQELAVACIFPCGGQLRDARFDVTVPDSKHQPPPAASVELHLDDLLRVLNDKQRPALDRAAIALWRFNWIHPFPGGNGRTARALAYLVLCMDLGRMLPGVPTMPNLIADRRDHYIDALREVDAAARALGVESLHEVVTNPAALEPMRSFVRRVAQLQMAYGVSSELLKSKRPMAQLLGTGFLLVSTFLDQQEARRRK